MDEWKLENTAELCTKVNMFAWCFISTLQCPVSILKEVFQWSFPQREVQWLKFVYIRFSSHSWAWDAPGYRLWTWLQRNKEGMVAWAVNLTWNKIQIWPRLFNNSGKVKWCLEVCWREQQNDAKETETDQEKTIFGMAQLRISQSRILDDGAIRIDSTPKTKHCL